MQASRRGERWLLVAPAKIKIGRGEHDDGDADFGEPSGDRGELSRRRGWEAAIGATMGGVRASEAGYPCGRTPWSD